MNLNGKVTNPGDLRTQVVIQRRGITTQPGGFQTANWTTIASVWAKWVNVHGSEAWVADSAQAEKAATATIRYRADVDTTCSVAVGGTIYEIVSMDDIQNRHEYIELKVKASKPG